MPSFREIAKNVSKPAAAIIKNVAKPAQAIINTLDNAVHVVGLHHIPDLVIQKALVIQKLTSELTSHATEMLEHTHSMQHHPTVSTLHTTGSSSALNVDSPMQGHRSLSGHPSSANLVSVEVEGSSPMGQEQGRRVLGQSSQGRSFHGGPSSANLPPLPPRPPAPAPTPVGGLGGPEDELRVNTPRSYVDSPRDSYTSQSQQLQHRSASRSGLVAHTSRPSGDMARVSSFYLLDGEKVCELYPK